MSIFTLTLNRKRMKPLQYELFTKQYFENRLKKELGYDVTVEHQATLTGKDGEKYKIDLHYELNIAGSKILTLIECKHWNFKVQRRNINDFRAVIDDLRAHKGIIVTKIGFDAGAISVAKKNGIGLFKLTDKEELTVYSNWTGTQDNLNQAYEFLESDQSIHELKGIFSGLFFSTDTSLWHFLMIKYGAKFGKYLFEFCYEKNRDLDSSKFEMPDDIRKILISINVLNLSNEYNLYETVGLNSILADEEFVKGVFNAITILQFEAKELSSH